MGRRIRLTAALLAGAVAFAGMPADAVVNRSGTIKVIAKLSIVSDIPADAALNGRVTVALSVGDGNRGINEPLTLVRTGRKATATVTLPYQWSFENINPKIRVTFTVSVNSGGSHTAQTTAVIAAPPNGSVKTLTLPASI